LYSGKALVYLLAVVLIGVSIWAFRKVRPWKIQKIEERRFMMIFVGILIHSRGL